MPTNINRIALVNVVATAVISGLAAGCGGSTGTTSPEPSPSTMAGLIRTPPLQVESVSLPDVTGNQEPIPFTMQAGAGRLIIVYFGYTHCPDLCPTTMAALRRAYRSIGDLADRIDTSMVTVDPAADTPTVLSNYLGSFFDRFHALRTTDTALLRAAEDKFLASSTITPKSDGTYSVSHTGSTYVVDERGAVVDEWLFGTDAERMASDLRQLLGPSS